MNLIQLMLDEGQEGLIETSLKIEVAIGIIKYLWGESEEDTDLFWEKIERHEDLERTYTTEVYL